MAISGHVAGALSDTLERIRQRKQEDTQRDFENSLRLRELDARDSEAAERREDREATRKERETEKARRLEAESRQGRTLANMAGIVEMLPGGLDPETARREIAMTGLRGGVNPPSVLDDVLPREKEKKRHLVTTPGPDGRPLRKLVDEEEFIKGVPEYREPKEPRATRAPSGGLTQRDIAAAMRQARRDAIAAYKSQAGPTGRVTDENGDLIELGDYVDQYVDDYMGDLDRFLEQDDETPARGPGLRLRRIDPTEASQPPSAPPAPSMLSSRGPSSAPPPPGAKRLTGLRRIGEDGPLTPIRPRAESSSTGQPQRPQVGAVVTLRNGTRVRVTGFDAAGKVQGVPVQ